MIGKSLILLNNKINLRQALSVENQFRLLIHIKSQFKYLAQSIYFTKINLTCPLKSENQCHLINQ